METLVRAVPPALRARIGAKRAPPSDRDRGRGEPSTESMSADCDEEEGTLAFAARAVADALADADAFERARRELTNARGAAAKDASDANALAREAKARFARGNLRDAMASFTDALKAAPDASFVDARAGGGTAGGALVASLYASRAAVAMKLAATVATEDAAASLVVEEEEEVAIEMNEDDDATSPPPPTTTTTTRLTFPRDAHRRRARLLTLAIEDCDRALAADVASVKALYRRGVARYALAAAAAENASDGASLTAAAASDVLAACFTLPPGPAKDAMTTRAEEMAAAAKRVAYAVEKEEEEEEDDAEVLKERRSPRERGRMGTSHDDAAAAAASPRRRPLPWRESQLVPGLRDGAWPSTTPGHPERGVGVMATMDVPRGTVLARETAYAALGASRTLVPIRPRPRGERRSLRTLPVASLRPPFAFNPHGVTFQLQLTPFNSTPTSLCMERPSVQKPHKKTRCHFCFRPLSPAPVPCRGCRAAVYCDDSCRERCERSGEHALWECGGACWAAVLPTEAVLAARVACRRASEPSDVADGAASASSSDVAASTSASSSASDTTATATPPRRAASSSPFERPPYAPDDAPPPRARRFDDLCLRWDDADAEERTLAAVEATVVAACLAARAVALRDVGVEVPRERVPGVVDVLGALCAIRANAFALKRAAAPAGDDGDDDDDAVFDPATVRCVLYTGPHTTASAW